MKSQDLWDFACTFTTQEFYLNNNNMKRWFVSLFRRLDTSIGVLFRILIMGDEHFIMISKKIKRDKGYAYGATSYASCSSETLEIVVDQVLMIAIRDEKEGNSRLMDYILKSVASGKSPNDLKTEEVYNETEKSKSP